MAKPDNKNGNIAQGYSQGLLSIAQGEGLTDQVEGELSDLREALSSNGDLLTFLKDPKVTSEGKKKALADILGAGVSHITHYQIALAIEQGRGACLPEIIDVFFQLAAESRRKLTAKVTTAVPLSEEMAQKVEETISNLAGEPIFLKRAVNTDLLGGIVIQLGDRIIDGSLSSQFKQLQEGISRKILTEKGRSVED
ncbi:MAG: ATP synthase F1 subunit delta [Nitrospiria bacterium]